MPSAGRYLALISLLLLAAAPATAGVPDPNESVCYEDVIVTDPSGGFLLNFLIKDATGTALVGSTVSVDFKGQGKFCQQQTAGTTVNGTVVSMKTDALGYAHFDIKGGGYCPNQVAVSADGVALCTHADARSPDFNGDLKIDVTDLGIFAGAQVIADLKADFNGDGLVNLVDLALWTGSQGRGGC